MSRFGWAYVSELITGSVANGPTNSIQFNSGSQILSGSESFTFDPSTTTVTLTGTLVVDGTLFATEYQTTLVSSSIIYSSGSTKFGDDPSDTHQFTGSILGDIISGTTAQFDIITGSTITATLITGSSLVISASVVSASTYLGITGGGSTTPGGSDKTIQFNSGSTFSGSTNLTFDYSTNNLYLTGALIMSGTSYIDGLDYIDFTTSSITNPSFKQGRMFYDVDTTDLAYYTPVTDVKVQIGQQTVVRVKNSSGLPINKGKLVHITGGVGDNPLINTASWENDANSANTLGMTINTINHDDFGYVLLNGVITGVNTDPATFTAGQVIYLSSSGDYTATTPVAPKHTVRLGEVIRAHATVGSIFIKIDNGYEIDELHNVLITSASTGDLLVYNSGSGLWNNTKVLSGSYSLTGNLSSTGIVSGLTAQFTNINVTSGTLNTGATVVSHTIPSSGENFVVSNEYNDKLLSIESNATKDIVRIGPASSTAGLTTEIYVQGNPGDAFLEVSPVTTFLSNLSGTTAQFTEITSSIVTGSTGLFTTISASVVSASSYVGPIPKNAVFAANGVTTGSNYEVITVNGNKYLELQKRRTFPIARSIGAADSEYGWTWLNRASISGSSTENTTVVSGANFVHEQVANTTWIAATHTAPVRYKTYTLLAGQNMQIVTKIAATASANFDQVQLLVWASGSNSNYVRVGVGYDTGTKIVTQYTSNTNLNTTISASQMLDGVWFAVNITENNFSSYYNFSTSSTPPTSGWLYNTGGQFILTTNHGRPLNVGQMIMNGHANPQTVTGSFNYFDVGITRNELANFVNPNPYVSWPATQFDTSGTEQLIGEFDLVGSSATINQTALRQLLADLENNQYLENATITWSAVQSDSSGASSGTFYSSSAVVVSGSGRYFRLWVKITSNGNQAGSVGPFPIVIPIS